MNTVNDPVGPSPLLRDLAEVLNRHGIDNRLGTPDHVIAGALYDQITTIHRLLLERSNFFGTPMPQDELRHKLQMQLADVTP